MGYGQKLAAGYATCSNDGCPNPSHAKGSRGLCKSCYNREYLRKKAAGWVPAPPEKRDYPCTTEGCTRIGRSKLRPSTCQACHAREHYHKKNPDAPRHPLGHYGKWKGVKCQADGCERDAYSLGYCVPCGNKVRYAQRKAEGTHYCPEARSRAHLKMRYGITGAEYDQLFAAQGGTCAICAEPPHEGNTPTTWKVRRLAVDHCHDTGKVRALLCNECNLIVKHRNNVGVLRKAIEYLEHHARRDRLDNS